MDKTTLLHGFLEEQLKAEPKSLQPVGPVMMQMLHHLHCEPHFEFVASYQIATGSRVVRSFDASSIADRYYDWVKPQFTGGNNG